MWRWRESEAFSLLITWSRSMIWYMLLLEVYKGKLPAVRTVGFFGELTFRVLALRRSNKARCYGEIYNFKLIIKGLVSKTLLPSKTEVAVVDPGGGSGGSGPLSDLRCFLLSPLSIAKPSPGSTKMHFSEPEISNILLGRPPNVTLPSAPFSNNSVLSSTSKNYPSTSHFREKFKDV